MTDSELNLIVAENTKLRGENEVLKEITTELEAKIACLLAEIEKEVNTHKP